jgi:hypothetical protein
MNQTQLNAQADYDDDAICICDAWADRAKSKCMIPGHRAPVIRMADADLAMPMALLPGETVYLPSQEDQIMPYMPYMLASPPVRVDADVVLLKFIAGHARWVAANVPIPLKESHI